MSSSTNPLPNAGLQLFPPPPAKKKPGRKPSIRRAAQEPPSSDSDRVRSPEPHLNGRQSAMDGRQSAMDGRQSALDGRHTAMDGRLSALDGRFSPSSSIAPLASRVGNLPRAETSFSNAPTLVRSHSTASHSSIAKPPLTNNSSHGEPRIRSIFPRYNPDLPLEQQPYFPTQASPTHIPKTIISKAPYSPGISEAMGSPMSAPPTVGSFPKGIQDIPVTRKPSTTEQLKALWKVANGWKVSQSEGRSFCLKLTSDIDAPVHTLSSATQPFYTVRLDPTSTSALLTMTRLDPNKPAPKVNGSSKGKDATGNEVLTTTLEETARRLPPNDGLVALLCPRAATEMALDMSMKPERPDAEAAMAAAEHEYARLVWDEDSKLYYLVHPAISTPFVMQINSLPAWSRVEYVFEHPELPKNLVKLVRDGSGGGFLEIDTGAAARINSFYLVDVAICAVLIVAFAEEKVKNVERFDAPPTVPSNTMSPKIKKPIKIDEMEIDLESQNSLKTEKKDKTGLPSSTKGALKVLFALFKCLFWVLAAAVKCAASMIICCSGCLTRKS